MRRFALIPLLALLALGTISPLKAGPKTFRPCFEKPSFESPRFERRQRVVALRERTERERPLFEKEVRAEDAIELPVFEKASFVRNERIRCSTIQKP